MILTYWDLCESAVRYSYLRRRRPASAYFGAGGGGGTVTAVRVDTPAPDQPPDEKPDEVDATLPTPEVVSMRTSWGGGLPDDPARANA